ncbi:MAG: DUF2322 family protein [Rhodoferax sp.]|nr:DUF2322 family protein [Rhodoferax sp.]MDP2443799.1 DUF2322 family protein [Rhodoferax sp.]
MQKFSDVLLTLDDISNVVRIELYKQDGSPAGVIENKPGSQGSVKVYSHLARMYGEISLDAAVEGLSLTQSIRKTQKTAPANILT